MNLSYRCPLIVVRLKASYVILLLEGSEGPAIFLIYNANKISYIINNIILSNTYCHTTSDISFAFHKSVVLQCTVESKQGKISELLVWDFVSDLSN